MGFGIGVIVGLGVVERVGVRKGVLVTSVAATTNWVAAAETSSILFSGGLDGVARAHELNIKTGRIAKIRIRFMDIPLFMYFNG